jgi:anti-sigma-K factor RskA
MNLTKYPDTLDRIAASYALGSLRGGARRRFEAMARVQAPVRVAALVWQTRFGAMTELQERTAPDPAVWTRIHNLVQADREVARMQLARVDAPAPVSSAAGSGGWLRSLVFWRSLALAGVAATVLALVAGANLRDQLGGQIASLRTQLQAAPQIAYVAVLSDDKSAASMLVTFDPRTHNLVLQRVGSYQEAGDQSLQLWALPPAGGPRSLGVLGQDRVLRVNAAEGDVRQIPMLAISLEPKGGVPGASGPTGPVLFKGPLVPNNL